MPLADETCACGASIHIECENDMYLGYRLAEWRKGHQHWPMETKTVGNVSVSKPWIERRIHDDREDVS